MKIDQTGLARGNAAQRLQSALGAFKPPASWGGSLNRGIGVVDPDVNKVAERLDDGRVSDGALPGPSFAPCPTVLATNERISEAPKLNRSIHRIKYETQSVNGVPTKHPQVVSHE